MDVLPSTSTAFRRVRTLLPRVSARLQQLDADGSLPDDEVVVLAEAGLLLAAFPAGNGGAGLDGAGAFPALRALGRASLAIGRLYEGHVNAVRLVVRHGSPAQVEEAAAAAREGKLFGVWNSEAPTMSLRIESGELVGGKIYCSGAGLVERALITARLPGGMQQMLVVSLPRHTTRADLSNWTAMGMRASATGTVHFDGIAVTPEMALGKPDAYMAQPDFSAGAWRFLAVQLGGMEAVLEAMREHLQRSQRGGDPHQAARFGTALAAAETARLWVQSAAEAAERADADPPRAIAYVNLARGVVERAALDILELATRSVGLQGLLRPHPLELLIRDLTTYLRQPAPDRALADAAAAGLAFHEPVGEMWP